MDGRPNPAVREVLRTANEVIYGLKGSVMDVLDISKPPDVEYAQHLARVVSKLSPILGNMIEFNIVSLLNEVQWPYEGKWIRQDPGFPDTVFQGAVQPIPGIEVKTWFPFATEITARFRESILHFEEDQTEVALVAWLPEHLLYGCPRIIDVWIGSAQSLALARDLHYHNPPDYLVIEPEDTSDRTANLQQTNANGYKFQGSATDLTQAEATMMEMGMEKIYRPDAEYQQMVRDLWGHYLYRLDTNFAKIDRIAHAGLEDFKSRVLSMEIRGRSVADWAKRLLNGSERYLRELDIEP